MLYKILKYLNLLCQKLTGKNRAYVNGKFTVQFVSCKDYFLTTEGYQFKKGIEKFLEVISRFYNDDNVSLKDDQGIVQDCEVSSFLSSQDQSNDDFKLNYSTIESYTNSSSSESSKLLLETKPPTELLSQKLSDKKLYENSFSTLALNVIPPQIVNEST